MFFKPISWKVNTGFDRKLFRDGQEHLIYRVNPGGGFAYQNHILGLYYGMVETDLNLSGGLKDDFALGFGASAGIIKKITDSWKIDLSARSMYYEAGDAHQSMKASLTQNFRISTNNSVTLSLWREKTFHEYQSEAMLGWNYYF
jgi:opacity protein-like surface antigen